VTACAALVNPWVYAAAAEFVALEVVVIIGIVNQWYTCGVHVDTLRNVPPEAKAKVGVLVAVGVTLEILAVVSNKGHVFSVAEHVVNGVVELGVSVVDCRFVVEPLDACRLCVIKGILFVLSSIV